VTTVAAVAEPNPIVAIIRARSASQLHTALARAYVLCGCARSGIHLLQLSFEAFQRLDVFRAYEESGQYRGKQPTFVKVRPSPSLCALPVFRYLWVGV